MTYLASLDVAFLISDEEGSSSDLGAYGNCLLSPRYFLSDNTSLTLLYNGSYQERRDFYSDEVGPRETTKFQRHTLTPMARFDFGENLRYAILPTLFYTRTFNKDVEGGGWNDGLYNYQDFGGGLGFLMEDLGFGNGDGSLRIDFQYYRRRYPNYDSLLDLATGINVEKDERDYHGILSKIGYHFTQQTGYSWGADYYLLYKMLDDKKVVDSNGILSSDDQDDYLHSLSLRWWYTILGVNGKLQAGLDLNGTLYDSNQNWYDGMGTTSLGDDVFLPDFYDYTSYRLTPNVAYTFILFPLTANLSYSYQRLDYTDRLAQRSDGTYGSNEQYEKQDMINFSLRYALMLNLSLYAQYQYIDVRSNNTNETVYSYNHTVHYYYAGVSLNF